MPSNSTSISSSSIKPNLSKPLKWIFYGDSITQGGFHTFGYRDYTELFSERIHFELKRKQDIIINCAASGYTSKDMLSNFSWKIAQFQPDVVFLMIGTNDSVQLSGISEQEFEANLTKIIGLIVEDNGLPVLQTPCPVIEPKSSANRLKQYSNIIRNLTERFGVLLIDHESLWNRISKNTDFLMSDGRHPNKYGHRLIARYLLECTCFDSTEFSTSRLFIPI